MTIFYRDFSCNFKHIEYLHMHLWSYESFRSLFELNSESTLCIWSYDSVFVCSSSNFLTWASSSNRWLSSTSGAISRIPVRKNQHRTKTPGKLFYKNLPMYCLHNFCNAKSSSTAKWISGTKCYYSYSLFLSKMTRSLDILFFIVSHSSMTRIRTTILINKRPTWTLCYLMSKPYKNLHY